MSNPKIDPSQITTGTPGGIATLDSGGQLPTSQLPSALSGAIVYKGTWDASTNTPTITSGVGTAGWEYIVSVAGTTTIDGISTWNVNDTIIFNGTVWNRIIGAQVQHVYGTTGQIVASANTGDVTLSLPSTITVNATSASNLQGGLAGNISYQTAPSTSAFITTGSQGQVLQLGAGSVPVWTSNLTLTNITFPDTSVSTTGADHVNSAVAITTATGTITAVQDYIGVNYAGAVALTLTTVNNKRITIKDESGAAGTNVITITPTTGLIEGQANITISVNWMALTLICRAGNWFVV